MSAPRAESRLRRALRHGAHLTALSAFALAQPLLDILGKNAAFFAVRGSSSTQIVLFALAVTFALPAALLAVELAVDLFSRPLAGALHLVFVAGLSAVVVLHALTKADALSGVGALVVAAVAGAAVAALYRRARIVGSFLSVLAAAPLLFLALFLFNSSASKLVFVSTPKVEAATVKAKTPVVLIVFDELTTVSLMDRNERVDAGRYPNFARLARESTWFRSGTSADWLTEGNVPAILTGKTPKSNRLPIYSEYPQNLFTLLGKSYRLRAIEAITHLCPKSLCRDTPQSPEAVSDTTGSLASDAGIVYLHLLVPDPYANDLPPISETWGNFGAHTGEEKEEPTRRTSSGKLEPCGRRVCEFADLISRDRKPTLYYFHTVLPHWPFVYLPSGRRWTLSARPLDAYKEGHWLSAWTALQGEQRYLLQLGYTDRALGFVMRRLRRQGVWDRALVIVTGDEGESFRGGSQRRRPRQDNLDDIAFVPLFVKLPGQTTGRVEDGLAPSIDVLPTIAHVLDVRIPWRTDGKSLVGRRLPSDGTVSVLLDVRRVSAPLSALRAKRKQTLAEQVRLFGTRTFEPVYRFGPRPELVGRRVGGLAVRPGSARVQLEGRSLLAAVDPSAELVPNYIAGSLSGAGSQELELAIALNGTIEATTKTFAQDGETRFAAFVPERVLRRGRNDVEVYAVVPGGLEQLRTGEAALVLRGNVIASGDGKQIRIDPKAVSGTVQVSRTKAGYQFRGRADGSDGADTIAVFAGGRSVFVGRGRDLRPLHFLGASGGKDRFEFELPRGLLPAPGRGRVRVFAAVGDAASELRYVSPYPWGG